MLAGIPKISTSTKSTIMRVDTMYHHKLQNLEQLYSGVRLRFYTYYISHIEIGLL